MKIISSLKRLNASNIQAALALITLSIIGDRLLGIRFDLLDVESIRISFGFLPVLFGSIWLGPVWGMLIGGAGDLIGFYFYPSGGFLPQIALIAMLRGFIPGFIARYSNSLKVKDFIIQVGVAQILTSVILTPAVLYYAFEINFIENVGARIIIQLLMIPFYASVYLFLRYINLTEKLKEREARLREITNNMTDVVWVSDLDLKITFISPSVEKVLGISPEDYINMSFEEKYPQETIIKISKILREELERESYCKAEKDRSRIIEIKQYNKDKEEIDLSINVKFVRDKQGNLIGLQGVTRDITDKKRSEELLYLQGLVLDQINDYVSVTDIEGRITYVNNAEAKAQQRDKKEIIGSSIDIYGEPSEEDLTQQQILEKTLKEGFWRGEIVNTNSRGEAYVLDCRTQLVYNNNKPVAVCGISTDISERKEMEETLRKLSFRDHLTGAYNRTYLEKKINEIDVKEMLPISIVVADVNGLKIVNDTCGHTKGDEVLKIAADIIHYNCKEKGFVARWGGDEFIIILPQTSKKEALLVVEKISEQVSKESVGSIPLSMSIGLSTKSRLNQRTDVVLKTAEDSMYKNKITESRSAKSNVLNALLHTLEAKSCETKVHAMRMSNTAREIGQKIGLSREELDRLNLLVTLHDIGKINISEEILKKDGPLTVEEWRKIKQHPEIGYRIARSTEEFAHVADDILAHHEKWNGQGYPQGLKGEEIPLLARIVAIADAYEVMTNGRPYKKPLKKKDIIREFKECAGSHFDPSLVEIFLEKFHPKSNAQD